MNQLTKLPRIRLSTPCSRDNLARDFRSARASNI